MAKVNDASLATGDAAALSKEPEIKIVGEGSEPSEVLVFDLK
jgi:hypothetical protein